MGATGTTTLDFGTFPGGPSTYTDVATAGVVATSLIEAWVMPIATADHTAEDHIVEGIEVKAIYFSDGNIRIYGYNRIDLMPPHEPVVIYEKKPLTGRNSTAIKRQNPPNPVGLFTVAWVWN